MLSEKMATMCNSPKTRCCAVDRFVAKGKLSPDLLWSRSSVNMLEQTL